MVKFEIAGATTVIEMHSVLRRAGSVLLEARAPTSVAFAPGAAYTGAPEAVPTTPPPSAAVVNTIPSSAFASAFAALNTNYTPGLVPATVITSGYNGATQSAAVTPIDSTTTQATSKPLLSGTTLIAVIAAGGGVGLIIFIVLLVWCIKRRRSKKAESQWWKENAAKTGGPTVGGKPVRLVEENGLTPSDGKGNREKEWEAGGNLPRFGSSDSKNELRADSRNQFGRNPLSARDELLGGAGVDLRKDNSNRDLFTPSPMGNPRSPSPFALQGSSYRSNTPGESFFANTPEPQHDFPPTPGNNSRARSPNSPPRTRPSLDDSGRSYPFPLAPPRRPSRSPLPPANYQDRRAPSSPESPQRAYGSASRDYRDAESLGSPPESMQSKAKRRQSVGRPSMGGDQDDSLSQFASNRNYGDVERGYNRADSRLGTIDGGDASDNNRFAGQPAMPKGVLLPQRSTSRNYSRPNNHALSSELESPSSTSSRQRLLKATSPVRELYPLSASPSPTRRNDDSQADTRARYGRVDSQPLHELEDILDSFAYNANGERVARTRDNNSLKSAASITSSYRGASKESNHSSLTSPSAFSTNTPRGFNPSNSRSRNEFSSPVREKVVPADTAPRNQGRERIQIPPSNNFSARTNPPQPPAAIRTSAHLMNQRLFGSDSSGNFSDIPSPGEKTQVVRKVSLTRQYGAPVRLNQIAREMPPTRTHQNYSNSERIYDSRSDGTPSFDHSSAATPASCNESRFAPPSRSQSRQQTPSPSPYIVQTPDAYGADSGRYVSPPKAPVEENYRSATMSIYGMYDD